VDAIWPQRAVPRRRIRLRGTPTNADTFIRLVIRLVIRLAWLRFLRGGSAYTRDYLPDRGQCENVPLAPGMPRLCFG
jgi:hypothetical protein